MLIQLRDYKAGVQPGDHIYISQEEAEERLAAGDRVHHESPWGWYFVAEHWDSKRGWH